MRRALLLRLFLPFAAGYFLSYLLRTINAIIAPELVRDLGVDPAELGLLTGSYLLAFALFQLPLGLLLDRYGPRRVESALLVVAALGAGLFAAAETLGGLIAGRALIGLGVSACLMAAFKAFSLWLPPGRLPLANGIQMVSGGAGALAATVPVEWLLGFYDWRTLFWGIALLCLLVALVLFCFVPESEEESGRENISSLFKGLGVVAGSRMFRSIVPWAVSAQAAYLALFGLWSGPWLRDIAGQQQAEVAGTLMAVAVAMIVGYFTSGALAERCGRKGYTTMSVAAVGMLLFAGMQALMVLQPPTLGVAAWLGFGLFGSFCILPYAALAQHFPKTLTGRASTLLNLLVFSAAFAAQWGVGVIINLWPQTTVGYSATGYRVSFGLLLVIQLLAAGWYFVATAATGKDKPLHSRQ